jgi:hypothetical protein
VSVYLGLCGALLFVAATILLVGRLRRSLRGTRTTGVVVDYTQRMRTRGERTQHLPHVRFVGTDLGERTFVSRMSASPSRWPVGTTVPVTFLASDPSRAEIATATRLWAAPAVMYLFAAVLGYAAIGAT